MCFLIHIQRYVLIRIPITCHGNTNSYSHNRYIQRHVIIHIQRLVLIHISIGCLMEFLEMSPHSYSICGTCVLIHIQRRGLIQCVAVCCSVLQCMLQCVAVCCVLIHIQRRGLIQCVAVCCSVLQCVAVCCSVLCPYSYSKTWPHSYSYIDNKIIIHIPYLSDVFSIIFRYMSSLLFLGTCSHSYPKMCPHSYSHHVSSRISCPHEFPPYRKCPHEFPPYRISCPDEFPGYKFWKIRDGNIIHTG